MTLSGHLFEHERDLQNHLVCNNLLPSTWASCSLTHALLIPQSVLDARATPRPTASSQLLLEVELISTIRAMDMTNLPAVGHRHYTALTLMDARSLA